MKLAGVALGGLAVGGVMGCDGSSKAIAEQECSEYGCNYPVDPATTQEYLYPDDLDPFTPGMQLLRGDEPSAAGSQPAGRRK